MKLKFCKQKCNFSSLNRTLLLVNSRQRIKLAEAEAEALERKLAAEQQDRDAEQQTTERKIVAELQLSRACREETEFRLAMKAESREAVAEAHAATERARQRAHGSEMERRHEQQEQEIEAARLLREVGDQGHGQGHGQANLFKPESVVKMLPKWHEDIIDFLKNLKRYLLLTTDP